MTFTERNEIFMDNADMIRRVMRRNWPLICAMRLDWDDVYQELAIAALNAIDTFDPMRSECIQAHIWMKLQYAVLTIKRQYRPCGLTGYGSQPRPVVVSLEQSEGMERFLATEPAKESPELSPAMRQALSRLDKEERKAVIRYLNDQESKRERTVKTALDKVRVYYLAASPGPQCAVGTW